MVYKTIYQKEPNEEVVVVRRRSRLGGLFLLVVLACLVGLSFYLGWLSVTAQREPVTNKVDVKLSVDTDKIKHDTEKAAEKTQQEVKDLSRKTKDEVHRLEQKTK